MAPAISTRGATSGQTRVPTLGVTHLEATLVLLVIRAAQ
jgi:hypothetical protein